jgi:hypothetical protein
MEIRNNINACAHIHISKAITKFKKNIYETRYDYDLIEDEISYGYTIQKDIISKN